MIKHPLTQQEKYLVSEFSRRCPHCVGWLLLGSLFVWILHSLISCGAQVRPRPRGSHRPAMFPLCASHTLPVPLWSALWPRPGPPFALSASSTPSHPTSSSPQQAWLHSQLPALQNKVAWTDSVGTTFNEHATIWKCKDDFFGKAKKHAIKFIINPTVALQTHFWFFSKVI